MIIAILPIKEISKELKGKNFKKFCGKPMYQWLLDECLACRDIDEIYISSSFTKLKEKLPADHVGWIQRPEELNGDVELMEVMKHALKEVGKPDDIFIQIQINKPLTNRDHLSKFIKTFKEKKLNTLFQIQKINTSVNWKYKSDRNKDINFKSCAMAKMWDYSTLKNAKLGTWGFGKKHLSYIVGPHHIEIDNLEDFRIAEILKRAGY